jgi:SNF2 family DNA or RNA helicase
MVDVIRYTELEPSALKIYKQLVKESFAELSKGEVTTTNVLTKLLRLSQLTGGFLSNDDDNIAQSISTAKLNALEDIVDACQSSGHKIAIIARFIAEIKAIGSMLEKRGIKFSVISGDVKDRSEQVAAFQTDPAVTAFIGQIATAGLGITLTAASTMVFFSTDYSMSNHEQARARIHRVGQKNDCTYYYLVAKHTVDEKVLAALRDKADLARGLVDDYRLGNNPFC